MAFYPINLNISGRRCLVVGGGAVAARKIEALLISEALVRVVSPEVCRKISDYAERGLVEWIRREYRESDLERVFLVFAATNQPIVQEQIAHQSKKSGVLLNSADHPDQCDFQVPAKIRRGGLLIAVSTGGASPALSTRIKHRLYLEFGPEYAVLVDLLASIRRQVVGSSRESEANRILFQRILAEPLLEMIKEEMWGEIMVSLETVLPQNVDCTSLVNGMQVAMKDYRQQFKARGRISIHDQ